MSRLANDAWQSEPDDSINGSLEGYVAWHQHRPSRYQNYYKSGLTSVATRATNQPQSQIIASGLPALDDLLPDGGWCHGAITEILSDINDESALNLVLPALATLSHEKKWLVWVGPPQFLDKFKLANAGIDISRVLLVHPRVATNGLWLVEQVLRAGTCSAVLTWMTGGDAGNDFENAGILGRLQQAAEVGGSMGFVFRDQRYASQDSPVTTRLLLKKQQQKIQLEILKSQNTKNTEPRILKPRILKLSANRLSRQGQSSQNHGNQNSLPKNQQLSLY